MSAAITIALLLLSTTFVESLKSLKDQTEEERFPQKLQQHENRKGNHNKEEILSDEVFPGSCRTCKIIVSKVQKEIGSDKSKLPGKCWACEWILNKVKKLAGPNPTAESLKSKLLSVCDDIGLLKSLCRKFVKVHLGELIEELTTTDGVRTICVNMGACKSKELELLFYAENGGPLIDVKELD